MGCAASLPWPSPRDAQTGSNRVPHVRGYALQEGERESGINQLPLRAAAAAPAQVRPHIWPTTDVPLIGGKICSGARDSCCHVLGQPLPDMSVSVTQHEECTDEMNYRERERIFLFLIFMHCLNYYRFLLG